MSSSVGGQVRWVGTGVLTDGRWTTNKKSVVVYDKCMSVVGEEERTNVGG